jgi:hypothetical protein
MRTVSLTIDYSNGSRKSFTTIPWTEDLTILEALEAAATIAPGIAVEYGSSRNGSVIGLSLDGATGEGTTGDWACWVNQRPGPERLGTKTSFGFDPGSRAANELQAGDDILFKRVTPPA